MWWGWPNTGGFGDPWSTGRCMGLERGSFWADAWDGGGGGGAGKSHRGRGLTLVNTWKRVEKSRSNTSHSLRAGAELKCHCPSASLYSLPRPWAVLGLICS